MPASRLRRCILKSRWFVGKVSVSRLRPSPGNDDVLVAQIFPSTTPLSVPNGFHDESQIGVEFTNVSLVKADCMLGHLFARQDFRTTHTS